MSAKRIKGVENRENRINRISSKLAEHDLKQRIVVRKKSNVFKRRDRKRPGKLSSIIAYDLETTSIKEGTPEPKYLTAFSDERNYVLSVKVNGIDDLLNILIENFLIDEFKNCQFVAWNANNFDVYFVALALMKSGRYLLRPYLTKSKSLRGLRVIPFEDLDLKPNQQRAWEFLDGISMLGLMGTSLEKFLSVFAPDFKKHDRESFEFKEFNSEDENDIVYAFRDSEGLYHGMINAQRIVHERFNMGLRATIGNLGIKIFESRIPEKTLIVEPPFETLKVLRYYVCRGGYCHLMRKYKGKVWKYDLNQAYAAAMRETPLPCGHVYHVAGESRYAKVYIAKVSGTHDFNIIPFYCKQLDGDRIRSTFSTTKFSDTWLTSIEIDQLRSEGWRLKILETWAWPEIFTMSDYVDALETLRVNAPGGPTGAVGTMIKSIGNNSYGKTLEQLEPLELVLASECPPGYVDYYGDENPSVVPYVWCRFIETPTKQYHQPQIGAFITAHVRMVVRRAALLAPRNFLYADTDCVIFDKNMTDQLDIDSRRYGAFKLESSGEEFMLIAKKVYASGDFSVKHSKGLNVKRLEFDDFVKWYDGEIPEQTQIQRQNFVKVMKGSEMFVKRTRKGTKI
jgi:hypothetical protein